ncbi:MAG: M20/M25/M40 family metallo-hydrolase [Bacteroidales bacterium]|nr:M20/M25/M40 family metallo-hydrolase [Bacteroidales bacterium]MCF8457097.1 M20/M25/M40 family metallo-hydrolase [Bacteroidales bacterium]
MRNYIAFLLIVMTFAACTNPPKYNAEITADEIAEHINYLASDSLAGRKPGTAGDSLAASYIRNKFSEFGLKLMGQNGYQYFDAVTNAHAGESCSIHLGTTELKLNEDFVPYSFSENGEVKAEAVFVGYGFDIDEDSLKWNDYTGVDVNGKWAIMLREDPELDISNSKFIPYSDERTKVLAAKDHGAAGVIFVSGVAVDKNDGLIKIFYDKSRGRTGVPVVNIKRSVLNEYFKQAGIPSTLEELENEINEKRTVNSFFVPLEMDANIEVIQDEARTQNVVAVLESTKSEHSSDFIVVGAHYDHLGMGGPGSGSRMPDTTAVHNGADDNASGVAGVIELAGKLASIRNELKRNIIFVAFSGEEMGLLGSKYFVDNPLVDLKQIKAMINFDMIGRLDSTKSLMIGGTGTAIETDTLIKSLAEKYPFKMKYATEGVGASDHSSFYGKDIPVFFFTTGAHSDYHTPNDDCEFINPEGEKEVLDFAKDLLVNLANRDVNLTFQEAGPKTPSRHGARYKVTLGIMPDFASQETRGLRVDMVTPGKPAQNAGMLKGDIITAINGMTVGDIYEYMGRLKKLEAGQIITVDVLRDDKKVVLLVQL